MEVKGVGSWALDGGQGEAGHWMEGMEKQGTGWRAGRIRVLNGEHREAGYWIEGKEKQGIG